MVSAADGLATTCHRVLLRDARHLETIESGSVHLVVTSPPYPLIEMWDEVFTAQEPTIGRALAEDDGWAAFRSMHEVLDSVWRELWRVLVDGGIACINIGDATRTVGKSFALYPNHARILTAFLELGFTPLPAILWRKQTNAPNKFMGSGMLPPGAYVTLEHEYVLVLRKGDKRAFDSGAARSSRRGSAFFWEERNQWFSDVWLDLRGTRQGSLDKEIRSRSGAFPFELPYRLISMFSVKGDTVLDPFLGIGTTMLAAMAAGRSSIGYEIDPRLGAVIADQVGSVTALANERIAERLREHAAFVLERHESKGTFGYRNRHYGFPVVTRQETDLLLQPVASVVKDSATTFTVKHATSAPAEHLEDWEWFFAESGPGRPRHATRGVKARYAGDIAPLDALRTPDDD